jgi:glycosyltransferase involved in cell wall biosynthesis
VAAGWDVTVISTTHDFLEDEVGSVDPSLLAEIPQGVDVARVPHTFDMGATIDVRSLSRWSANLPQARSMVRQKTRRLRRFAWTMGGASPDVHDFTDNYVAWIDPVVKTGMRIDSRKRVDHVLATGNPFSSFEAARQLAGILGVEFSVDYRDPWTIDVFTGSSEFSDHRTRAAERRIVHEAWRCFHVNEAIADGYRALFPDSANKQMVVPNGFDAQSIPSSATPATPPYRFGILGTLNDRWPVEPIFAAWMTVRPHLPAGSELVLGGHLGYFARSTDLLEAYLPDDTAGFRYLGPIPKHAVAEFYSSLDVLILAVPGGAMVTSGKAYEANALGMPVVLVQAKGGGARQLLADNPLVIGVDPEPEPVADALLRAVEMAQHLDPTQVRQVREHAARYERQIALTPMVSAVANSLETVDRQ